MTVLKLHSEPLQDQWLDAYGHLNEAYYLVPFSNATWKLQAYFDIGVPYFEETGCAIYTVETHLRYVDDVRQPAEMQIESLILESDAKKIRFVHMMNVKGELCATGEFMVLHYNTRENATTAMPDAVQTKLQNARAAELPNWAGRRIAMGKQ